MLRASGHITLEKGNKMEPAIGRRVRDKEGAGLCSSEGIFTQMKWSHWRALQRQLGDKEEVGRPTRGWKSSSRCGEVIRNLLTSLRSSEE